MPACLPACLPACCRRRYCSPSRSSLFSGRLPIHVGELNPEPSQPGFGVDVRMATLADQLRAAGYATHQLGKWHLGMSAPAYLPTARGFDSSFGCESSRFR